MVSEDLGTSVEVNYFLADTFNDAKYRSENTNIVIFGDNDPKHSSRIRQMILGRNVGFVYNGAKCKALSMYLINFFYK